MQNQENKKQEELSIDDRLTRFIERKEAEQKALKKMIEKLEEDSARKLNHMKKITLLLTLLFVSVTGLFAQTVTFTTQPADQTVTDDEVVTFIVVAEATADGI
jgi:hypothetical protein